MPRPGTAADPRQLAVEALVRIERDGAYANLVVPRMLDRAGPALDRRARALVTDLVYGTVRRRRACDFLVDRFLDDPRVEIRVRAVLRLGAYQLQFTDQPAHAAVATAVGAAPRRARGLVNAVLRRVAHTPVSWPDDATRLSYPDWVVERLVADLGVEDALAALDTMNEPAPVTRRADGYVQDRSSQLVVEAVGAEPGERIADVCAAPGGKATGLAVAGVTVVASDVNRRRLGLVVANRDRVAADGAVVVVAADAANLPYRDASFDRVLVDAPCTGLGALRRRPDARWRVEPDDVGRLARLQVGLLHEAARVVRPGGLLVYSVCTLTHDETAGVATTFAASHPTFVALAPPAPPWRPLAEGARLLPTGGADGMALFRWRRTGRVNER